MKSQEVVGLRFQSGDRNYRLQLRPLALFVDEEKIGKLKGGSERRLQSQQLKVLKFLLEHPNRYHAPGAIAAAAGLRARNLQNALRQHVHYLRDALQDGEMQLIRTQSGQPDEGTITAYGLFAVVEPIRRAETEPPPPTEVEPVGGEPVATPPRKPWLRRAAGVALIAVSLFCLYLLTSGHLFRSEPRQRQITRNSAERPIKAMAVSPDGSYIAYAEKTGAGGKTNCQLWHRDNNEFTLLPALRDSEIFRLSWADPATLLVSGKIGQEEPAGLWLVPILAGSARPIRVPVNRNEVGEAAAMDRSHIAYIGGERNEIWQTAVGGQQPLLIFQGERGDEFSGLVWLAGGRRLLFNRLHLAGSIYQITAETLDLESRQTLIVIPNNPRLRAGCASPNGRLYYALEYEPPDQSDTSLWEMRIDPATGEVTRAASIVVKSVGATVHGLSTTAAGDRLVLLKGPYQADVWVGDVDQTAGALSGMRRLTHDDSNDLPTAWTPDGRSVLFHSNRGGKYAIYRQDSGGTTEAERIVYGDEDYRGARVSPDGRLFSLSRHGDWSQNKTDSLRLNVSALNGDDPRVVYARRALLSVHCPRAPGKPCVLGQRDIWPQAGELLFHDLADDGPGRELGRVGGLPLGQEYWDVSPDGSRLAVVMGGTPDATIRVLGLDSASSDVIVKGHGSFQSIDWAADGSGWYVSSRSARSADLLYVDLEGNGRVLWRSPDGFETWGVPSPDGSRLAVLEWTVTGNVWLIDEEAKQISFSPILLALIAFITGVGGVALLFWSQISALTGVLHDRAPRLD